MKRTLFVFTLLTSALAAQELKLPNHPDSLHFAVIGDTGTGGKEQYQIAELLTKYRTVFPFDLAVMMGDNLYGGEKPADFAQKFEIPYQALLKGGVKFYAALGNHDDPNQRFFKGFNMGGERYYSFKPKDGIRFFALDSNYMDPKQMAWLEKELGNSASDWKIAFFHHPLYSSGEAHGPSEQLRSLLEPLFIKQGVSLVLTGHEHFYERIKPQKGITYIIVGSSAKLRKGDLRKTDMTAKGFDSDNAFMLCEIKDDQLFFQTISRTGQIVDSGVITRPQARAAATAAGSAR